MALYETTQDFPAGVGIRACTFTPLTRAGVIEANGAGQMLHGQGWGLTLEILPMERAEVAEFESFLLSLRGGAGTFRLGDPFQSLPLGAATGTPVTSGATRGAEALSVTGWTASTTGQLMANDKLEIAGHLYTVLATVDSDGAGAATVDVWPPLRESYEDGTTVVTSNARGTFALTGEVNFSRDAVQVIGLTLTAREVRTTPPAEPAE